MRLGLQAYGSPTGLGNQTHLLYKLLKPDKVMLVDISSMNGMPVNSDWYDFDIRTNGFPTDAEIDQFLDGIDAVFVCETPLNYYLFSRAKELGVRTILQANPEFLDYMSRPELPRPSVIALPSTWMGVEVSRVSGDASVVNLPVPVDDTHLPKRHVTAARTFFHIAGRPAAGDRNGTLDFIKAAKMAAALEPDMRFVVYCQQPNRDIKAATVLSNVELVEHLDDYADLYRDGDVLVLPRKYGGLCLPAQEAVACGIPVLMPSVSPNTSWMPSEWLVDVLPKPRTMQARSMIDVWDVNANSLAQKMLDLYRHPDAVEKMGQQARELATTLSWETLEPQYRKVIEGGDA